MLSQWSDKNLIYFGRWIGFVHLKKYTINEDLDLIFLKGQVVLI